jgi:tetratricopeptide (TPR) repeat protein
MRTLLGIFLAFVLFQSEVCSAEKSDTTAVRLLHKKAFAFWSTYPDSLLHYRDSSYHVAVRLNDKVGIAESFTDLGVYYWVKGNYARAIHAYDTSNQIFESIKRPDKRLTNFSNLGMVYSRLGDFPKAINTLLASLRLAEESGARESQAKVYNSLGVAYKNQGNIAEASNAYLKALIIFKEVDNQESVAGCYTNMGNIQMLQKNFVTALDFQMKGLRIFDSLKNFKGLVTCNNNISDIHLALKNYKDALTYRNQALTLSKKQGFFSSEVVALSGIGSILSEMKDYKGAEQNYLEAIALVKEKNYRTEIVNLYKGLSACYKGLGKEKDALLYFEKYAALKDSLFNQQTLLTVSNLQTSYDLEKKEAAINLLKKDNEITQLSRNRIVLAAIAVFLVGGLIVVLQRQKIRKEKQLLVQKEKLHETEQALSQVELKAAKIKQEELLKEIEYKNKSLTTYALSMVQKNEMLEEVKESVELILKKPEQQAEHFKKLSRLIDYGFTLDKDWEDFKLYFEDVHTDFFVNLRERFPGLGGAELKLCALMRLNLNTKQAAAILRISPDSVKVARHRLRKKFNLQTEENLTAFILSL